MKPLTKSSAQFTASLVIFNSLGELITGYRIYFDDVPMQGEEFEYLSERLRLHHTKVVTITASEWDKGSMIALKFTNPADSIYQLTNIRSNSSGN